MRTFELRSNSITRRSYGENPATSRMTERTNLVRVDEMPLRWEGFTTFGMAVVGWPFFRPVMVSVREVYASETSQIQCISTRHTTASHSNLARCLEAAGGTDRGGCVVLGEN